MNAGELNRLTATEAVAGIAAGEFTSEALVADCLSRIADRDAGIGAWVHVDPEKALSQARERDREGASKRPLHGLPVGIKDVLDTRDMPTEYGSVIYRDHRPRSDSRCVAVLREAGAVILGKTTTTEFASPVPVGVRNPHDSSRTPGVSSSGSAAAVADFMTPLANGTQTGGSVILPAAFCGVVGYKASIDGLDRGGIRSLKSGLDTLGYMARSVADIALIYGVTTGRKIPPVASTKIGVCRTASWSEAEPAARKAVEDAAEALATAGYDVSEVTLSGEFDEIEHVFRVVSNYEGKQALVEEFRDHGGTMNYWLREMCESSWTEDEYGEALTQAAQARDALGEIFGETPVLLTPSTSGEAPADLESLTVSTFNRLWTLMHGPTVTLPVVKGPAGMPVGVQLVSRRGTDAELIAQAAQIESVLKTAMGGVS